MIIFYLCDSVSSILTDWSHVKGYLVVHDGSQTHDTNMNVIFLTDESWILQSSTAWQSVGSSHQSGTTEKENRGQKKGSLSGEFICFSFDTWWSVELLVGQRRMERGGCSPHGDPLWNDSRESQWMRPHLRTLTAHHQTWTQKQWLSLFWKLVWCLAASMRRSVVNRWNISCFT